MNQPSSSSRNYGDDITLLAALKGYRAADLLTGLTVGIVAVPFVMALVIASGVPPQYGLYTAIVAARVTTSLVPPPPLW